MEPILKLTDVNKCFGGVVVAEHIDLELYPGEIHGLIGPNGAGKTTLLNLISGLYEMDSGSICFCGRDISKTPDYKRAQMGLGRTFQTPRFLDKASIEENLMVANDLAKPISPWLSFVRPKDRSYLPQLQELTEMAGLQLCMENDISSLTFGQRKLLEIIRAILTDPKALLVDEPAAGLNGAEVENVNKLLHWATKELGAGVILIEHSMDMIMRVCQRITVLNFGRVIACGTADEISANEDVIAAYLGRDDNA